MLCVFFDIAYDDAFTMAFLRQIKNLIELHKGVQQQQTTITISDRE